MNKPIRALSIGTLILFLLMLININYIQAFRSSSINDETRLRNARARDAECARERGPILVDGDTVAESVPINDELEFQRKYREAKLYAAVTGFYSCIFGSSAIELSANSVLSGSDESLFVNRMIDLLFNKPPKGASVLLTINPEAQRAAFEGLDDLPGDAKGAVVALDPRTGAILAMTSTPSYNPSLLANHDNNALQASWNALNSNPDQPMLNRTTQEVYPPGSTFKLIVSAAALANGYSPDTKVRGGSTLDLPLTTRVLRNENGSDCGGDSITLTQALVVSCNVSFGDLGLKLGDDVLREQAERFGFDEDYLDQLPLAISVFPADPDAPSTAYSAIGQFDVAATPLQMALVVAGIANGGSVMKPYVVAEVRSPDLEVMEKARPTSLSQAVAGSVADDLTQMMVDVVENGTGQPAQIDGVSVAGKTGTANSSPDRPPYAWFVAFAPADDPQVAIAVLVESSGIARDEITGGGLAGPIASAVMRAVIGP